MTSVTSSSTHLRSESSESLEIPNLHHLLKSAYGNKRLEQVGTSGVKISREEHIIHRDEATYKQLVHLKPELDSYLAGWARSYYTIEAHIASILSYNRPYIHEPTNDKVWLDVKLNAKRLFESFDKVYSMDFETELRNVHFESDSAAGMGYQGKKGDYENQRRARATCNAQVRELYDIIRKCGTDKQQLQGEVLNWHSRHTPDIAFTRTQLTYLTEKLKVRNIFGAAFHHILMEGLSAQPLMEYFQEQKTFFSIGFDPKIYVPVIIRELTINGNLVYTIDWSKFDATVHEWEIDTAFDLVKIMLRFPNKISETAFEAARALFIHRKLIGPDGTIYHKHSGIPSGSYFTMLIGTIINKLRIDYVIKSTTGEYPIKGYFQGDDSITEVNPEHKASTLALANTAKRLDWIISPEKSKVTTVMEDIEYLGRGLQAGYNKRDELRVIRLAVFTEFPVDSNQISTARVHMLCLDTSFRIDILVKAYQIMRKMYGEISIEEIPRYLKPFSLDKQVIEKI